MKRKISPESSEARPRKRFKRLRFLEPARNDDVSASTTQTAQSTTGLHSLPVELLYDLLLTSLSPSLPFVSRHIYHTFRSTTPYFRAQYILAATESRLPSPVLRNYWPTVMTSWLRFGVCDLEVFKTLETIFKPPLLSVQDRKDHGSIRVDPPKRILGTGGLAEDRAEGWLDSATDLLRYLLTPRTLNFASSRITRLPSDDPLETTYAVDIQAANVNAHSGFFLARAVHLRHRPLVDLLLSKRATPLLKHGLALKLSIAQKDYWLVRSLLGGANAPVKLGKLGRELLTLAVKEDTRDISNYLVKEHGVVPDMGTLRLLMRTG